MPFIFSGRPVEPKNAVDDRLASNALDLYATICDYAGVEPPDDRMGKTLRPILESQAGDFAPHDYLAAEEHLQHLEKTIGVRNCHIRSIRTQEWKYIAYSFGPRREQLFHIRQDPGEVVNLAHVNRYRPVLQQHRDLLRRWCRQTQDGFGGGHYARPDVPFMVPGDGYDEA